jgi:ABC-type nitrate/sulfonate/bicarbonate transport system permease component
MPAEGERLQSRKSQLVPALTVAGVLVLWQLVCVLGLVPGFMLPAPTDVVVALVEDASLLASHAAITLAEAALGLVIGVALGFVLAVLMDRFATLRLALTPLVTLSQTIPTLAIAPLLVLWFGYGLAPKVLLVVISTFFPVAVSLLAGFESVDADQIALMRTMGASRRQVLLLVKIPAAADSFFSGLRISATYAIVGALIAEWLGGFAGLGVYMTRVRKSFSYDRMFAVIALVSALSLLLMRGVDLVQGLCMPWKRAKVYKRHLHKQ